MRRVDNLRSWKASEEVKSVFSFKGWVKRGKSAEKG